MLALLLELAPPTAALCGMLVASLLLGAALARLESGALAAALVVAFLGLGAAAQDMFDRAADHAFDMLSRSTADALGLLTAAVGGAAIAGLRRARPGARRAALGLVLAVAAAFGLRYLDELEPKLLVNATPTLAVFLSGALSLARLLASSLTVAAAIRLAARKEGSAPSQ